MQELLVKEETVEKNIDGDLLNRQEFINQVINIIEIMAAQKKNSCFAINGGWGVGKSFVLGALEQQLQEIQDEKSATDKYLIFHYNCWQYDYYEEPLVAIVAAILDTIEEKKDLLSEENKSKLQSVLKAVGNGILHKVSETIEEKAGINVDEIINVLNDANEEATQKIEDNHSYDVNFLFKKALTSLQNEMRELAKEQTIIFVVDELDRCLPEYSVKVLERLHHIFEDIPNIQVIISIDRTQLSYAVQQIFGKDTDVKKYLAKFIKFEINLDTGNINTLFDEKFAFYISLFDYAENSVSNESDITQYKAHIFDGIDMRSCIEIVDRCYLLHTILNDIDKKMDYSYMCVEIFLSILKHFDINFETLNSGFNLNQLFVKKDHKTPIEGLVYLNKKLSAPNGNNSLYFLHDYTSTTIRNSDIWGVILGCYRCVLGYKEDHYYYAHRDLNIYDYAISYWNILQIIS